MLGKWCSQSYYRIYIQQLQLTRNDADNKNFSFSRQYFLETDMEYIFYLDLYRKLAEYVKT